MASNAPYIADTAVVNWVDAGGHVHLRVYESDGQNVTERLTDGSGWQTGTFSQPGGQVAATAWYIGGQSYVRVYCSSFGATTEWCSDAGGAWYKGAYTDD